MDNFDFVGHLASTAHAYDVTAEIAESFIRLYYRDMHAVEAKWQGYEPDDPERGIGLWTRVLPSIGNLRSLRLPLTT